MLKFILIVSAFSIVSCSTKQILEVEDSEEILKIDDYDKTLKVKDIEVVPVAPVAPESPKVIEKANESSQLIAKKSEQPKKEIPKVKVKLPALEDSEGFVGRRPVVDPFRIGERVRMKLSYFNIVAGYMDVEVLPFKEVNGRKSYHFRVTGKSNDFFSKIYSVDDQAETFIDYEEMIPYNMSIDVKETKQLRTVRSYFDWKKKKGVFWEKKITKKSGLQEKKYEWDIMPYSQNIFSAVFYMRTFTLKPGKTISFRVADEKKNMVVKGHVLGIEKVSTEVGEIEAIKLKPEVQIEGVFKPIGDVFFYLTNDDRKMVVRIESKIKIGTIVAKATEIIK